MNSAAAFISAHIEEFGILGTNNAAPDDLGRAPLPACTQEFTRENHFRFGFDGGEFNSRQSATAKYAVEFGRPSRSHQGFVAEFTRAMSEIDDIHGPLSVSNTG